MITAVEEEKEEKKEKEVPECEKINGKTLNYAGLDEKESVRFTGIETKDKGVRLGRTVEGSKIPLFRLGAITGGKSHGEVQ